MVVITLLVKFLILLRFPPNVSIADQTRGRYGDDVLSAFRTWERLSVKNGKAQLDLNFLRTCRDADLVPKFLQFKLSSGRLRNSGDVTRFRRRLLAKEIRNKERKLAQLGDQVSQAKSAFQVHVRHIDFVHYSRIVDDTVDRSCQKSRKIQERKVINLRSNSRSANGLLDPESVIVNKSSYELSDVEMAALSRGLKYALPPGKLQKGEYFSRFEVLFDDLKDFQFNGSTEDKFYLKQKLGEMAYNSLYNFNMTRSNMSNMPKEEFDALLKLSKNKDIIISKPDKGSGIIILDRKDYVDKMLEILSDENKFRLADNQDIYKISRTVETRVRNYLRKNVLKPGYISESEYKMLYPNRSHIGVMYGLPKVHKTGCPMRPICSAVGTSTYELGKFVNKIIKPASVNAHGTDLRNTFDFVTQVSEYDVSASFMVSYDVQSLFTNVPLSKTVDICMDRLYRSSLTPPSIPEEPGGVTAPNQVVRC